MKCLRRPDITISPRVPIELIPRVLPLRRFVKRFEPLQKLLVVRPAQILYLVFENARDIASSPVHDVTMGLEKNDGTRNHRECAEWHAKTR